MRAIQCRAWGEIDNLALVDIPPPDKPGPGEILVDVPAAGVNFADLLMTAGKYQERPMPPFTPGFEIAGTSHDIRAGADLLQPGNRALALLYRGGFSQHEI